MAKTITQRVIDNARARGVTIYTRSQWGSLLLPVYQWRRKYRKHSLLPGKPVDTVWQHITVTYDTGSGKASFKEDMRTLERIGNGRFGSGVSYNWCVDATTGEVGLGQSLDAAGTHTLNDKNIPGYSFNQNYVSLAIAIIGMPGAVLSQRAGNAIVQLIKAHIDEGAVTEGFDYNPHRMVAWKDCPTNNVVAVMPGIRRAVDVPDTPEPRLTLEVGTFNIGPGTIPSSKMDADLDSVASKDLDFFGLQEVEKKHRDSFTERHSEYRVVGTCVSNRIRFKLLHHGRVEMNGRTWVGRTPGKRSWIGPSYFDWVHLEDRETKAEVWHANAHLVSSPLRNPLRMLLHRKQRKAIAVWMESHKDHIAFVTADWNLNHANWKTSNAWRRFRELGFTPNWRLGFTKPTFGSNKWYDAVWSTERARKHWIDELFSDHNGVRVKYGFRI